jgi:hypothetical protein
VRLQDGRLRTIAGLTQAEHLGDHAGHLGGVLHRRQLDQPDPVREQGSDALGQRQRQPGLADAGRPDQCQQPDLLQEELLPGQADLMRAADKRRWLEPQVVRRDWPIQKSIR